MKKFFTFFLALVAVMAVNAKQVVFDFSDPAAMGVTAPEVGKSTNITAPIVVDGVTMTGTKGTADFRFYNSNGTITLRVYKTGGTVTFAAEEDINAVVFEGSAVDFAEMTGKSWAGEPAKSVTFTANTNSTLSKATIYIGETPDIWVADTVTVSQANALVAAEDKHDHFVKGVVMCQPFITYDSFKDKVSFWMNDAENPADTIEFYDGMGLNNQKWASLEAAWEELRIGDTILVYAGAISSYTNQKTGVTFNEITAGYYAEKLGANPNPPAIVYPTVDTITTAQAVEIAQALAEPAETGKSTTTAEEYVVGGYAVKVYDRNSDGTWSFFMNDEQGAKGDFQASNATIAEGVDTVITDEYIYLRGKIAKRKTNSGNIQLQIYKGTAVHGEAPAPAEVDTISVADAKEIALALDTNATSAEKYYVIGYVAKVYEEYSETYGNISIYMTDDPESTYGELQCRRAEVDEEVGPVLAAHDKVLIVGKLTNNYYNGKSTAQIYKGKLSLDGQAQAIENILLKDNKINKVIVNGVVYIVRDGKMFNLQGAQVR